MRVHVLAGLVAGLAGGCATDDLAIDELGRGLTLESDKLVSPEPHWGEQFGTSIEAAGDLLLVGGPYFSGTVRVFQYQGGWELVQVLEPAGVPSLSFGSTLALDGDRIAATSQIADRWAVHIFDRVDDTHWIETATILAPYPGYLDEDHFSPLNVQIALEGNRLVVGNDRDKTGAAFSYLRQPDGGWTLTQKLSPPALNDSGFGGQVAMSSGRLAVGTQYNHVYLYTLNAAGLWTKEAVLKQAGIPSSYLVGVTGLDLDDDVAMVGFLFNASYVPEVRVYKRINGSWNNIQGLPIRVTAIDIEGPTAVLGSAKATCGRSFETGCAYVAQAATATRSTWGLVDTLKASDGVSQDRFGAHVAVSDQVVAVGAPYSGELYRSGAVYFY